MTRQRIDSVREHFDGEATIFDARVVRMVPHYREMLETMIAAIPFPTSKSVRAADLGCGTGTVAWLVKERFRKARITCIDFAPNMLALARHRLGPAAEFDLGDLHTYSFKGTYDAMLSSLVLHHVKAGPEKAALFRRIHGALAKGGVFLNTDIFTSRDRAVARMQLDKWAEFILRSYPRCEVQRNYRRYKQEDRPADPQEELVALRKAGFHHVEMLWKYYNFGTYIAVK